MRAFLVPLGTDYDASLRAEWPIIHPTTDQLIGHVAVADLDAAPAGCYDLGDPLDDVSLRQTTLDRNAANAIASRFGVQANTIRNRTGAQVLKILATRIFANPDANGRPVRLSVDWDGLLVEPVKAAD